jgi:integrase
VKCLRDNLRTALNVAMNDWELIKRNPASKAKPPAPAKRKIRVWDVAQAKAFLDAAAGHRWGALFSVAVCLGPRQGEALGLQWPNLDLERGKLTIDGALKREGRENAPARVRMVGGKAKPVRTELVKGKTKREASNRTIALPAVTVAALLRHRAQQEEERQWAGSKWQEGGYVFTTRKGTPIDRSEIREQFLHIVKLAGVPQIRFHDMRHSAATLLFAQGVHPKTVMEMLGWSDLKMPMEIYGHVLDQQKIDAAAKMNELFGVATTVATKPIQTPSVN